MSGRNSPLRTYDARDWYWHVGGLRRPDDPRPAPPRGEVYSSARGKYVPADDPEYMAWLAVHPDVDRTAPIESEDDLVAVLHLRGITFGEPAL